MKNQQQNMETSEELGLNQEAIDVLIASKAGGIITKNLVALGERMLIEEAKKK